MKQRMQGMVMGVVLMALLLGTITVAAATRRIEVTYGVNVTVNGVKQNFPADMQSFTEEGGTFLLVRAIADALGLDVVWSEATSAVIINSQVQQAPMVPVQVPPAIPEPFPQPVAPVQEYQEAENITTPAAAEENPPISRASRAGDIVRFGEHDWRVLDMRNNQALIITENIIFERPFHNRSGVITWDRSELRQYLNNDFFNSFNHEDRSRIQQTNLTNNDNPWFSKDGGGNTRDRIFLLSIEEAVQYFGDSGQLHNRPGNEGSIDDRYNDARIA